MLYPDNFELVSTDRRPSSHLTVRPTVLLSAISQESCQYGTSCGYSCKSKLPRFADNWGRLCTKGLMPQLVLLTHPHYHQIRKTTRMLRLQMQFLAKRS